MQNYKKWWWALPVVLILIVTVVVVNTRYQKGSLQPLTSEDISAFRQSADDSGQKPDLAVRFDSPTSIQVTNKGGATKNSFKTTVIFITVDGKKEESFVTAGLGAGGFTTIALDKSRANSSSQMEANVDSGNSVVESDEGNNTQSFKKP